MTERERLVRLIDQSPAHFCDICHEAPEVRSKSLEGLADCLIEHGYRKASDVAREIFTEIEGSISLYAYTNDCDKFYDDGVLDVLVWVDEKIDELKKKYTEDVE